MVFEAKLVSKSKNGLKAQVVLVYNGKSVTRHLDRVGKTDEWQGLNPDDTVPARRAWAEKQILHAMERADDATDYVAQTRDRLAKLEAAEGLSEVDSAINGAAVLVLKTVLEMAEPALPGVLVLAAVEGENAKKVLAENPAIVTYAL